MSFLKSEFMAVNKIEKDFEPFVHYPTGFTEFDYRNGYRTLRFDENNVATDGDLQVGASGGSITAVIGPSGSGKTTFALQMTMAMAKKFKDTVVIHFDLERSTSSLTRIIRVTGLPASWFKEHYIKKDSINTEELFDYIKSHAEIKLAHADELTYDTGYTDEYGRPIKLLTPSFILIDSLSLLMPAKNAEAEGMGTNMDSAQAAKANAVIFKKLMPIVGKANIQFIFINHVGEAIQTSMFDVPKKQVNMMGNKETMPGGKTAVYLSNNIIKLEAKAKFKEDDKYKMEGFPVLCKIYKSRSNRAGQEFEMLYTQTYGFSNPMSLFHMAKNKEIITGSAYLQLPGYEKKFRNAEFITKYNEDKEFREAFEKAIQPTLDSYIVSEGTGQAEFSPERLDQELSELMTD